jgi:ubiquitin-protein ligase
MSNVRLRRLQSDYEAVRRLVRLHPRIQIEGVFGNPPERYRLKLKVTSLRERGEIVENAHEHHLEITLPRGYPRDAPLCRMLTPVFHPNIAPHAVCIGDHWTAAEPLDLMIQRVGEMLAFQSYNVKSPLNGRAAQWVEEHVGELPTDKTEFFLDLTNAADIQPAAPAAGPACANCAATGVSLETCRRGHALCGDCALRCDAGEHLKCLLCGDKKCAGCELMLPARCANCGSGDVSGEPTRCSAGHDTCDDCLVFCKGCGKRLCFPCGTYPCQTCAAA